MCFLEREKKRRAEAKAKIPKITATKADEPSKQKQSVNPAISSQQKANDAGKNKRRKFGVPTATKTG